MAEADLDALADMVHHLKPWLEGPEATFLDEAARLGIAAAEALPGVAAVLARLDRHEGPPVVVLRLPARTVSDLPRTPVGYLGPSDQNLFQPDTYRALLVSMHGWYGYGFRSQQAGVLHNNVVSLREFARTPGHSASAGTALALHTEDASYNTDPDGGLSPDFLSLHFFRNPDLVPSVVADVDCKQLPSHILEKLRQSWFSNLTNPGQGGSSNDSAVQAPVVYGPSGSPWIRFNTARLGVERYGAAEREALETLRAHLQARRVAVPAQPGDVVFLDNRRVTHGRPPFGQSEHPRFDGEDRWQRRLALAHSPGRLAAAEVAPRLVDPVLLPTP